MNINFKKGDILISKSLITNAIIYDLVVNTVDNKNIKTLRIIKNDKINSYITYPDFLWMKSIINDCYLSMKLIYTNIEQK